MTLKIFIGYDPKEPVAYHVLSHSILTRASAPVAITPVARPTIPQFVRERGPYDSTDFSISRFMVPSLCDYKGYAIFMDCDMLCQVDIHKVMLDMWKERNKAVWVCKHDYVPRSQRKFLDQVQTSYERKNWSSFMVFNNAKCKSLTPHSVNNAAGLDLHRFRWLKDEEIGGLPLEWNWLVDEYEPNPEAHILHYTLGGPWFPETAHCAHADLWNAERARMLDTDYRK